MFLGSVHWMVLMFLVLVAVGWLVVALIFEQERHTSGSTRSRAAAWRGRLARAGHAAVARGRSAWEERRSRHRATGMGFGVPAAPRRHRPRRDPGDGWHSRLVALLELILFVMLISALFAGALAAAAMRIGHFGT